jgi:hypothetical protein
MDRRTLLKTSGIVAASGLTALAGCIGSNNEPPPRKSNVINNIQLADDGSTLSIDPVVDENQWVQSRRDIDIVTSDASSETRSIGVPAGHSLLAGLSPIGVARAAKGRGSTGRGTGGYSSATKTSNGRAWFWGGSYARPWYNDHDDEIEQYPVDIATLGIAYIGPNAVFEEQDPGPGPVTWDETYEDPTDDEIETSLENLRTGWYRVGANIVTPNGRGTTDLGWECVDLRIEDGVGGKEITERWKVSPRI